MSPLAILCLSMVTYSIISLVYSRLVHPLRNFAGPFWGSVTDLFATWLFSTRQSNLELLKLHGKYGDFVRISPNMISFSNPYLLPQVYHSKVNKTAFYSTGIAGVIPPLLQIASHQEHAEKVRVLGASYSMKNLKLGEECTTDSLIVETMRTFSDRFVTQRRSFDLAEYIRFFTYDSLTSLIYGKSVGMIQSGKDLNEKIREWHAVFPLGGLVSTLPWLIHPIISCSLLSRFLMPQKGQKRGSGHITSVHESLYRDRLKHPDQAKPGNVFDILQKIKLGNDRPLMTEEAERECLLITVGGQDTSPALMSAFFDHLCRNSNARNRLYQEIAEFEEAGKLSSPVVRYEETTQMPYFSAMLQETLRLEPSAAVILPRYASGGGIMLGDTWIPGGTELAANPCVIHRDRRVFGEDAEVFKPERWLDSAPEDVARMKKYFFAFGYGSRKCLGRSIGLFTSSKFCIQLLREFDIYAETVPRVDNFGLSNLFIPSNLFD